MFPRFPRDVVRSAAENAGTAAPVHTADPVETGDKSGEGAHVAGAALAGMVAGMNRFVVGLAGSVAVESAPVGLGEWLALNSIAKAKGPKGITAKRLALVLGVSVERVQHILAALQEVEAVVVTQDGRNRTLNLTVKGEEILNKLNSQFEDLLIHTKSRTVSRLQQTLRRLGEALAIKDPLRKSAKSPALK